MDTQGHVIVAQPSVPYNPDHQPQISIPLATSRRRWTTDTCDCMKDEETCWWGTWCCWIVHARTVASFDLGSSINLTFQFWAFIIIGIVISIINLLPLGVIYFLIGGFYFAYARAQTRTLIRNKLNIEGDLNNDMFLHYCCSCCSICQEAREANEVGMKSLDFCSGEELSDLSHEHAVYNNDSISGGDILSHIKSVSKTSKIILILCSIVALFSFIGQIVGGKYMNIAVLLLVFVQPLAILYVIYWRSRRKYASLDYVIKLFAIGFWFTTFQSIILETLLQVVIGLLLLPFYTGTPPQLTSNTPTMAPVRSNGVFMNSLSTSISIDSSWMARSLQETISDDYYSNNDLEDQQRHYIRRNIVISVIGLILMAYIVAAGVEETMKNFIVRCCRFPVPLKDPHTVLVYLMAGALGFATFENIEYVFGTKQSPIPGYSLFIGELLVLLVRVLMPIHVICSVLQTVNVSKLIMGMAELKLFQILLPAIFLHGTYDMVLFVLGTLYFAYPEMGTALAVLSVLLPALITIAGAVWAYSSYKKVQNMYDNGWSSLSSQSDHPTRNPMNEL